MHTAEADVPAAAMLDPVANTLDLRAPFNTRRARRVEAALQANGVGLSDARNRPIWNAAESHIRFTQMFRIRKPHSDNRARRT